MTPDFRKIFESGPGLYLVLKSDLVIAAVSDAYLRATMTDREAILGRSLFDVFPDNPDDPQATGASNLRASLERVLANRAADAMAVQKYDIRRPETEGGGFEVRYWSPLNAPVLGDDGAVEYIIHRVKDVTDLVHLKELESEQSRANEELKSRAGQMELDILRRAQELQEANDKLRLAKERIKTDNEILEQRVADRVEQLKAAEDQVRQLQKMDAIGALAGGLAHDFNNILGAIKMYCDLLTDQSTVPQAVIESAREIRLVTDRGAALTRQLLIFSRKQIVQSRPLDLNELMSGLMKMLHRLIGENIHVVLKPGERLHLIKADPGQIEQVIMNLVVNARDAMATGGTLTIATSNIVLTEDFTSTHLKVTPGPHVALSITDTGCGMTPETQARLFEPFFTTKPMGKGTGLGLPTAYGIIKQSKGTIWVYSEIGKGSVFKIYFPALDAALISPEPEPGLAQDLPAKETETILLVEDEERLRQLYSAALERFGYKVLAASDGESALKVLDGHEAEIHLLLTDVVMPKMGGVELAKAAKIKRAGLRVLYMSGYADDPAGVQSELGDALLAFLQKPFDTGALVAKVKEVLKA